MQVKINQNIDLLLKLKQEQQLNLEAHLCAFKKKRDDVCSQIKEITLQRQKLQVIARNRQIEFKNRLLAALTDANDTYDAKFELQSMKQKDAMLVEKSRDLDKKASEYIQEIDATQQQIKKLVKKQEKYMYIRGLYV